MQTPALRNIPLLAVGDMTNLRDDVIKLRVITIFKFDFAIAMFIPPTVA